MPVLALALVSRLALLRPAPRGTHLARVREAGLQLRALRFYARLLEGEASVSLDTELIDVRAAGVADIDA